jgi:hypothetical protein
MEKKSSYEMKYRYAEYFLLTVLILLYGVAANQRNLVWKDEVTLWSD